MPIHTPKWQKEISLRDIWERLSLLRELRSLIARFYQERHAQTLNPDKATEIIAILHRDGRASEGRIAEALPAAAPVLWRFALQIRGLLLFLEPGLRENGIAPSHRLTKAQMG